MNIDVTITLPTGDEWGFILELHGPSLEELTNEERDGYIAEHARDELLQLKACWSSTDLKVERRDFCLDYYG